MGPGQYQVWGGGGKTSRESLAPPAKGVGGCCIMCRYVSDISVLYSIPLHDMRIMFLPEFLFSLILGSAPAHAPPKVGSFPERNCNP